MSRHVARRFVTALMVAGVAAIVAAAPAAATPGPPLRVGPAAIDAAVTCAGPSLATAARPPVLLVHGTFVTADVWRGGFYEALQADGHPACLVEVPDFEVGDVQDSVQYVVGAIRLVRARAGRPIAVVGHSQGAFLTSFALRFWPDLASGVSDFAGLAGVYDNGTTLADTLCLVPCGPAGRQLRPGSALLTALARRPVYPGPSVTALATRFDEVVTPQPRGGLLGGARQLVVQDRCPAHVVEHGGMSSDAVAYAVVRDAVDHPGPGDLSRIPDAACAAQLVPGAAPTKPVTDALGLAAGTAAFYARAVGVEPPVRCVFVRRCTPRTFTPGIVARLDRRSGTGAPWTVRTRGAIVLPSGAVDLCAGTVSVAIVRGTRTVSTRRAAVRRDCSFASTARLGGTARAAATVRGRLRIRARYLARGELRGAAAPTLTYVARRG
ncbi:hypothetical protein DSM112329_00845 [Paraconexibacter sp. AEG42_29]|uniref:Lipase n=1 Tax=Paraconexibacter sp. AEG42_29 TaxID=2997339 RepID=A0AAU7AQP6_9ACTN